MNCHPRKTNSARNPFPPLFSFFLANFALNASNTWNIDVTCNSHLFWQNSLWSQRYGDRKPNSALGRIYAMVWILIGIVIFSVFTAVLTTASSIESVQRHEVRGIKVRLHPGNGNHTQSFNVFITELPVCFLSIDQSHVGSACSLNWSPSFFLPPDKHTARKRDGQLLAISRLFRWKGLFPSETCVPLLCFSMRAYYFNSCNPFSKLLVNASIFGKDIFLFRDEECLGSCNQNTQVAQQKRIQTIVFIKHVFLHWHRCSMILWFWHEPCSWVDQIPKWLEIQKGFWSRRPCSYVTFCSIIQFDVWRWIIPHTEHVCEIFITLHFRLVSSMRLWNNKLRTLTVLTLKVLVLSIFQKVKTKELSYCYPISNETRDTRKSIHFYDEHKVKPQSQTRTLGTKAHCVGLIGLERGWLGAIKKTSVGRSPKSIGIAPWCSFQGQQKLLHLRSIAFPFLLLVKSCWFFVAVYNSTAEIFRALDNNDISGMMMDNIRALYYAPVIEREKLFAIQFYSFPCMHGIVARHLSHEVTSCLVEQSETMQYRILERLNGHTAPIKVCTFAWDLSNKWLQQVNLWWWSRSGRLNAVHNHDFLPLPVDKRLKDISCPLPCPESGRQKCVRSLNVSSSVQHSDDGIRLSEPTVHESSNVSGVAPSENVYIAPTDL